MRCALSSNEPYFSEICSFFQDFFQEDFQCIELTWFFIPPPSFSPFIYLNLGALKMAKRVLSILLLCLLAAAASVSARPCKTLFFITTTTTTFYPRNPNPDLLLQNPRYLSLVFTTTTARFPHRQPSLSFVSDSVDDGEAQSSSVASSAAPGKFYSSVSSSIRDRSKDIMEVVGALLVGVGFGVLTGVVIFFVWALFFPRQFDFSDGSESEDDEISAAKKLGYVKIPAESKVIDGGDGVQKAAPPAKEVV